MLKGIVLVILHIFCDIGENKLTLLCLDYTIFLAQLLLFIILLEIC